MGFSILNVILDFIVTVSYLVNEKLVPNQNNSKIYIDTDLLQILQFFRAQPFLDMLLND